MIRLVNYQKAMIKKTKKDSESYEGEKTTAGYLVYQKNTRMRKIITAGIN